MIDISDCYVIVFTDAAGMIHSVPFQKKEGGNAKANTLLEALHQVGLPAQKYGPYTRPA